MDTLLEWTQRMKRALGWYADTDNYLDGVPYLKGEDGLMGNEDNGAMARNALRRVDVSMGVVVAMPAQQKEAA